MSCSPRTVGPRVKGRLFFSDGEELLQGAILRSWFCSAARAAYLPTHATPRLVGPARTGDGALIVCGHFASVRLQLVAALYDPPPHTHDLRARTIYEATRDPTPPRPNPGVVKSCEAAITHRTIWCALQTVFIDILTPGGADTAHTPGAYPRGTCTQVHTQGAVRGHMLGC